MCLYNPLQNSGVFLDFDVLTTSIHLISSTFLYFLQVGTVDCCDMIEVEKKLNVDRRGLIAMAMLSGCDYDKDGVQSVGVQKAYEFVQLCTKLGVDPLKRYSHIRIRGIAKIIYLLIYMFFNTLNINTGFISVYLVYMAKVIT